MKKKSILTIIYFLFFVFNSEGQINIQQINSSEFEKVISSQSFNLEPLEISSITQLGNYNTAKMSQTKERDMFSLPNSSNLFQQGDFNLADINQKGNENVLFSFQLGYLIYVLSGKNNYNQTDVNLKSTISFNTTSNSRFSDGTSNTLISYQEGNSNKILVIQQGRNHYIEAAQLGNENNLFVQQAGNNNRVENFKQNSFNGKSDVITQVGDNITINTINEYSGCLYDNNYTQEGSNLSIVLNNSALSPLGGIRINQTGHDMKVVIDQSFFSFPMR